jgi:hypothetical protein
VFIFKLSHSCLSVSSISFLNFTNNTNREAPYCLFSPFSCFLLSLMSISSLLISDMLNIQVVCDMTPCRLVNIYRRVILRVLRRLWLALSFAQLRNCINAITLFQLIPSP